MEYDSEGCDELLLDLAAYRGRRYADAYRRLLVSESPKSVKQAEAQMATEQRWFESTVGAWIDTDEVLAAIRKEVDREG